MTKAWVNFIFLIFSLIFGLIGGYLLYKFPRFSIFLMGGQIGYMIFSLLWILIIHYIF